MLNFFTSRYIKATTILFIFISTMTSTGCGSISSANKMYKEKISHILITKNEKILLAIGEKYHYYFKAPTEIIETIKASYHEHVSARLFSFEVNPNGAITGFYSLNLEERLNARTLLSTQMIQNAKNLCYKAKGNGLYICMGKLSGIRYKSRDINIPDNTTKLNRKYRVEISEINSTNPPNNNSDVPILGILLSPIIALGMGFAILLENYQQSSRN